MNLALKMIKVLMVILVQMMVRVQVLIRSGRKICQLLWLDLILIRRGARNSQGWRDGDVVG